MNDIEKYLEIKYPMEIVEDEEGGYAIRFPDLTGCITCGDTIEEAIENAKEAKRIWLEDAVKEGIEIPEPNSFNKYTGQLRLRIPKSLHREISQNSKREGISMNQYCIYILSKQMR